MVTEGLPSDPEKGGNTMRIVLTIVVVAAWVTLLAFVLFHIDTAATDDEGRKLGFDTYGRLKDILLGVAPFLTLVLGYYSGAKGTDKAQADASTAKAQMKDVANKLNQETSASTALKSRLLTTSTNPVVDEAAIDALIQSARDTTPQIFG